MKPDAYTKAVLTVIAAALVWIGFNYATPATAAQANPDSPLHVIIVDNSGRSLIQSDGLRVNLGNQPWPVVINQPVPVTLTAIDRRGAWQPIPVDVLKTPPTSMPGP
jgi:hypothetical protein